MHHRRILRVDANSTLEEVSRLGSVRSLVDGSIVALVYEAENARGERSLVFESAFHTVRLASYPDAWQQATDFDLLALWQSVPVRRTMRA